MTLRLRVMVCWLTCLLWLSLGSARVTIIDALAQYAEFSELVRHLQRHALVMPLNQLSNTTFFAPNNEAFRRFYNAAEKETTESSFSRVVTADQLRYHLVAGEQWPHTLLSPGLLLETLFIPKQGLGGRGGQRVKIDLQRVPRESSSGNLLTTLVNGEAQIVQSDIVADNGIIHMVDRLLVPPQRLVGVLQHHDTVLHTWVHWLSLQAQVLATLSNQTGFTVFAPRSPAFLEALGDVERQYLVHPFAEQDLGLLLGVHIVPQVIYRQDLLGAKSTANVTEPMQVRTLSGDTLTLSAHSDDGTLVVNGRATVTTTDILAANGVIHITDEIFPTDQLVFTPEKYLIGLNATRFVTLLRDNGLASYLHEPHGNRLLTILAPTDNAFDNFPVGLPPTGSQELHDMLQYHMLPQRYTPHTLQDQQHIASDLRPAMLNTRTQWIRVTKKVDILSPGASSRPVPQLYLAFNDVTVSSRPITLGNTVIYILTSPLSQPTDLLRTVVVDLRHSTFLSLLYISQLQYQLPGAKDVTYFVPSNSAFSSMDLAWSYLMLAEARDDLQHLLRSMVAQPATYSFSLESKEVNRSQVCLKTLSGDYALLVRDTRGTLTLEMNRCSDDTSSLPDTIISSSWDEVDSSIEEPVLHSDWFSLLWWVWRKTWDPLVLLEPANDKSAILPSKSVAEPGKTALRDARPDDQTTATVEQSDTLVENGVIQYVDQVVLPHSVNITLYSLLRGAGAHIFLSWLRRLNMTEFLHAPLSKGTDGKEENLGYTVFVPSDRAIARLNISEALVVDPLENGNTSDTLKIHRDELVGSMGPEQLELIRNIVKLHVIPQRKITRLQDRRTYSTLLGTNYLISREYDRDHFSIQIAGAYLFERHFATVVRKGVASNGVVYQIDNVLIPIQYWFSSETRAFLLWLVWLVLLGFMGSTVILTVFWPLWLRFRTLRSTNSDNTNGSLPDE
ncbi:hypothetical protein IWQ62_004617 [Dispira parvispora]|uniref:FAS1 domain-containing protein n=1 Tax=Dispira parvispora TaxID=1520584 RepID=A0A9W8ALJ7_9FUNG|nr:hypothetical protein IWQ62_004617 [Dispira parvispora]